MESEKVRNRQIDGLRGITITMIVVYHVFCRYQQIYMHSNIPFINHWGELGVSVFLLISAYFVGNNSSGIRILLKKIFRLWPTYVVSITITMVVCSSTGLLGRTCTWKDYWLNFFFINGYIRTPYVDGAHWYLTTLISIIIVLTVIENLTIAKHRASNSIVIYLLWMSLSFLLKMIGLGEIITLIGGAYAGIACVSISIKKILESKTDYFSKVNIQWIILIIISCGYSGIMIGRFRFIMLIISIPIFVVALLQKAKILEYKLFQFIGKISYPLYLIHQNIAYVIEYKLMNTFNGFSYLYAVIAFVVVMMIGAILYYCVEKPVQKLIGSIAWFY